MSCYKNILNACAEYKTLSSAVKHGRTPVGALGLPPVGKAHVIFSLCTELSRRAVVVLPDEASALKMTADLNVLSGRSTAVFYPARDFSFNPAQGQSREFEHARIRALEQIINNESDIIVCSAESALQLTLPPEELDGRTFTLKTGETFPVEHLVSALLRAGFVRTDMVEGTGQFSVRGGIADIFPPNCESPLRIEYWGNDIDTISVFDTDTQRRTDMLSSARIAPATEVLFDSDADFCDTALALAASLRGKSSEKVRLGIEHDAEDVKSGLRISSLDRYLPVAYERTACVFDYMDDALVFVGESSAVKERAVAANRILNEDIKALLEGGVLAKPISKFMLAFTELQAL